MQRFRLIFRFLSKLNLVHFVQEDKYIPCKEAGLGFVKGDIIHIVSQVNKTWNRKLKTNKLRQLHQDDNIHIVSQKITMSISPPSPIIITTITNYHHHHHQLSSPPSPIIITTITMAPPPPGRPILVASQEGMWPNHEGRPHTEQVLIVYHNYDHTMVPVYDDHDCESWFVTICSYVCK